MTTPRLMAVKPALDSKFDNMRLTAEKYWKLREAIMEQEYQLGFHEHAYSIDRSVSGESEAWSDFGRHIDPLSDQLEDLKRAHGSVEKAFLCMKQALLVDTDAILNETFQTLKAVTGMNTISDLSSQGRLIYGYEASAEEIQVLNLTGIPVKFFIVYGRHQANHYLEEPGRAVDKLFSYREVLSNNIAEGLHWQYATDLLQYFDPRKRVSMSDEIIKILGWLSFDDLREDLEKYF